MTLGDLVQFIALFGLLAWPMRFIGWILSELPRAVVSYARLEGIFAEPVTVLPATHPVTFPDGPLDARLAAVTYSYAGTRVLDEVSLRIAPDESVAIVGPTGVGKSTLAQLLVRLDDPDDGEVLIGGVNLRHADAASLRDATAIVFQESFLFAAPVRENIGLDTGADREAIERAARLCQADAFIRRLPDGYDTVVGERGHTLSGGQRQRVALARALRAEATPVDPGRRDVRGRPDDRGADPAARSGASCVPRSSWSPTVSRRSAWPTGSCTSRTDASAPRGPTTSCSRPCRVMPT